MLDQMRKQAQSTIVLLLFGFIIFVFVFSFGAGSVGFRKGGCGTTNAAALVNGEKVTLSDYKFLYQQELQRLMESHKNGRQIQKEDKLQLNDRVLNSLIDKRLVLQAAMDLGLRVTNEERNDSLRNHPWFKDKNGNFDYKKYKNIVQWHFKTTPAMFEELWKENMLFERMAGIIQATARVTDEELEAAYRYSETKVDLEYVSISPAIFKMGTNPTDEQVQAYMKDHEAEIQKFYDSHKDRYHKPKKVKIAHVFWELDNDFTEDMVTDRKERAELTLDDLNKGADFSQQVKDYSQDSKTKDKDGVLGTFTKEQMTAQWGAHFAEVAIALKQGEHSKVVKSEKGFHVIKCLKVIAAVDRTEQEAKSEIAKELISSEQAEAKAMALANELFDGMKTGKSLEDLLAEKNKKDTNDESKPKLNPVSMIRARKTGLVARMGGYITQLGLDKDLARAAFKLTEKSPFPEKVWKTKSPFGGDSIIVLRLLKRQEPDMKKFKDTREQLRDTILKNRGARQLSSWLQRRRESATIEINQALHNNPNPLAMQQQRR